MPSLSPPVVGPPAVDLRIPKIIHRVWLGDAPMPEAFARFGETWQANHPDWEMRLWRESDLPELRNQALFDAADTFAGKADIVRYELLLRYGGIYVDTDFECLRPFEALLDGLDGFIGTENGEVLTNALIGTVPGHPFLEAAIEALPASITAGGPPNETSGPAFLSRLVQAQPDLLEGWTVFPPDHFYPYLYNESHRSGEEFPHSYAVHHWEGSWSGVPTIQAPRAWRLVLATDWSAPGAALAVFRPFARLFAAGEPVELVLAVPHEPCDDDVAQVVQLLGAMGIDPEACADIGVESFAEVLQTRFDTAVVPVGDADRLVLDVAAAVDWMHATRELIDEYGRPGLAVSYRVPVGVGRADQLLDRLSAFRAEPAPVPAPPAPAAAPAPAPVAQHRATYLGNDRLLVSTNWAASC